MKLGLGVQVVFVRLIPSQQKCVGLVPYIEITRSMVLRIIKARRILRPVLITTTLEKKYLGFFFSLCM